MELLPNLSIEENSVFKQLSYEPIHIDELCNQMKKDTQEVLSILLLLELKKTWYSSFQGNYLQNLFNWLFFFM